jgi:small subunit ribosomal protein S9
MPAKKEKKEKIAPVKAAAEKKVQASKPEKKQEAVLTQAPEIKVDINPQTFVAALPKDDEEMTAEDFDFIIPLDKDLKSERYYEAIGRRKTAVARVRFYTKGDKQFLVNDKPYQQYFSHPEFQEIAVASLKKMKCLDRFRVSAKVSGGGVRAQAEAVRHGTARVLVGFNPNFRKRLRKAGFLTRDPRMRERKKFGLKRARRAPQWAKR